MYNEILYSRNLRSEYEKTIAKHRPDLVKEGLVSKTVDGMFAFIVTLNVNAQHTNLLLGNKYSSNLNHLIYIFQAKSLFYLFGGS